jgi:hypothetical protein
MYAKTQHGLDRALAVQRIVHNWVRPHWAHNERLTPAQVVGLASAPMDLEQLVNLAV